jgi:hypothetical protein
MNKLKELWSYAVFRWFCLLPLIAGLIFLVVGCAVFAGIPIGIRSEYELAVFASVTSICITTLRVWWRPIWKLLKQAIGFLNKKAEEG